MKLTFLGATGTVTGSCYLVETAGRKVIVYIEDMAPGETLSFTFQAVALYPVRGKGAVSSVYS